MYGSIFFKRSFSGRNRVIDSLKLKFNGKVTVKNIRKIKISVVSPIFNGHSKADQYKAVFESLPDEWKSNVIIETRCYGGQIDRQVKKIHLNDVNQLSDRTIRATPQSLLDDAVFNLNQNNSVLASECLWQCGSLALKNFALANHLELRNEQAENYLVDFIIEQCGKAIWTPWIYLNWCRGNTLEGRFIVQTSLSKVEQFCNLLHTYHSEKRFDFKKAVPEWMHEKTKTEDGTEIKWLDFYFKVI